MSLPFDIARCVGTDHPICADCRRREPGDPHYQSYFMTAPVKIPEHPFRDAVDERSSAVCEYKIGEK